MGLHFGLVDVDKAGLIVRMVLLLSFVGEAECSLLGRVGCGGDLQSMGSIAYLLYLHGICFLDDVESPRFVHHSHR